MKPAKIRKHRKRIGTRPFSGMRYVQNGVVRVEWRANGGRYTRTIGKDCPRTRQDADDVLERALSQAKARKDGRATDPDITLSTLLVRHRRDAEARRLAPKTISVYGDLGTIILRKFDGAMKATDMRRGLVRQWMPDSLVVKKG